MQKTKWVLVLVFSLLLAGCVEPNQIVALYQPSPTEVTPTPIPPSATMRMATLDPNPTPSATPFQPASVTPTITPTWTRTSTATPTATPEPTFTHTPAPTDTPKPKSKTIKGVERNVAMSYLYLAPGALFSQPKGQVNYLLLGSDQRPNDPGFRTDTILLVTIYPKKGTVNITSFPRDLYVLLPGRTNNRINTAFGLGGFDLLADTFAYNFGVRPDSYVLINFDGFVEVVDSLEGIDVKVEQKLRDHRDGHGMFKVTPGTVHMDGEMALWYVRSRKSTSDFDRTRRQQEVVIALLNRLLRLNAVKRARKLYNLFQENVNTNMRFKDLKPLLSVANKLNKKGVVNRYAIKPEHVSPWITPGGAYVLLPNRGAVLSVMKEALNSP